MTGRPAAGGTLRSVDKQGQGTLNAGKAGSGSEAEASATARPGTVTGAAALTGVIAALLLGYGIYLVVAGFTGQPVLRGRAELGGALFAVFGLGVGWVARGLLRIEPWARTPALLTHLLLVGSSYRIFQDGLYGEGVPVGLFGLAGIVLLFVPASHRVLSRDVR